MRHEIKLGRSWETTHMVHVRDRRARCDVATFVVELTTIGANSAPCALAILFTLCAEAMILVMYPLPPLLPHWPLPLLSL